MGNLPSAVNESNFIRFDQVPQSNQGIKHLQNDHYNHKISNAAELLTESTSALNENFNLVHLYFVLYCKIKVTM